MIVKTIHSLEKVFFDRSPEPAEWSADVAARGEVYSFQVMLEPYRSAEENGKYYATKEGSALLDFGAIGKGYALMCLKEICEDNQLTYYLINAGSSSILVGENPYAEDHTFTVGVSDVEGMKFKVKNEAIGTSSVTNQHYFDVSTNTLYSHVVNPKTGNAVPALTTAIVLGENAGICDVLSTYFLMLGESADVSTFEEMGYSFFFYDNRRSDPSVYLSEDFPITEE